MRIHLVFVGKTAFRDIDSAVSRYLERLGHYVPVNLHYVKAEKVTASSADDTVRTVEGERILKVAGRQGHLIALDRTGRQLDSPGLAGLMEKLLTSGISDVWMVVGGPVGLSAQLLNKAQDVLSFSKMTFQHDLARLMLVEQLYRAFTIIKGEPYHR